MKWLKLAANRRLTRKQRAYVDSLEAIVQEEVDKRLPDDVKFAKSLMMLRDKMDEQDRKYLARQKRNEKYNNH